MTESSKGTKVKNPTFYIADSLGLPAVGQYQTNYKPPAVHTYNITIPRTTRPRGMSWKDQSLTNGSLKSIVFGLLTTNTMHVHLRESRN